MLQGLVQRTTGVWGRAAATIDDLPRPTGSLALVKVISFRSLASMPLLRLVTTKPGQVERDEKPDDVLLTEVTPGMSFKTPPRDYL